jgi:hypothetical protein
MTDGERIGVKAVSTVIAAVIVLTVFLVRLHVVMGFCTYYCGYGLCRLYTRNYKYNYNEVKGCS